MLCSRVVQADGYLSMVLDVRVFIHRYPAVAVSLGTGKIQADDTHLAAISADGKFAGFKKHDIASDPTIPRHLPKGRKL